MAYAQGEVITAADYNTIATDVNDVFADNNAGATTEALANYGYGEAQLTTPVSIGNSITAAQWTALFTSLEACATHQGTSQGIVPSAVTIGDLIEAYDGVTGLLQVVSDIRSNRLTVDAGQSAITSGGTRDTSTRNSSWTNQLVHEFTADFGSYDDARHFFNSGGQIRFSGERTGGSSNPQNTDWTTLLSNMSTVIFDHTVTTATSGGTGSSIGFYNLTNSFQQIYTISGSFYGANSLTIEARSDAAFGSTGVFRFRITLDSEPGPDVVDGTIRTFVDDRRSTGAVVKAAPTYTTVTELSAGS